MYRCLSPMSLSNLINKQEIISATDQCVMCGLCLPHCPTYAVAKSEPESPRGRIAIVRALYEGKLTPDKNIHSHLEHCLTCMACEQVCPANIDYEKIIDAGRSFSFKQATPFAKFQQSIWLFSLTKPSVRKALKTIITATRNIGLNRLGNNFRAFSLLPDNSGLPLGIQNNNATTNKDSTVLILNSCAGDLVNDSVKNATKIILTELGYNIIEPKQTLCCGALHQHSGQHQKAHDLRVELLDSYQKYDPDHVVSLATGCGAQIKRYPKFSDETKSVNLANKLVDVNEFIFNNIINSGITLKPLDKKVYLHKPCSQQYVSEDTSIVEQCLKLIPKIEIIHFEDKVSCCGAGGINTLNHVKLAETLIHNKISEVQENTADYLVSSNIGCALHFQASLRAENTPVQVCHPLTLLAKQIV